MINSPGDDEFEENNISDLVYESNKDHYIKNMRMNQDNINVKSGHMFNYEIISSNEGSPKNRSVQQSKLQKTHDDVTIHKEAYNNVYKYYPPNPILPKSHLLQEGSPKSGGDFAFL